MKTFRFYFIYEFEGNTIYRESPYYWKAESIMKAAEYMGRLVNNSLYPKAFMVEDVFDGF